MKPLILLLCLVCAGGVSSAPKSLCDDERAALSFLEFITAPMSVADEKEWWEIGGKQHGIFGKRYNIAFVGYAAAALGQRGDADQRRRVVRILDNCVSRLLKRDVWAYSQSKNYWGAKPWAPDPCYRENVMYTGHLLHVMALYELFSGDSRYWTNGFDFVWSDKQRVHYDVPKLIQVTVDQMRANKHCGVTCEPGLLFFPCNNHPHYAFKLWKQMGRGDWTEEGDRWEKWALDHFVGPIMGGGAFNLVYHVKSGLFYPRGQSALDGWSLLWYEAWAKDRTKALALWRRAAEKIDWSRVAHPNDIRTEEGKCTDPQPVTPAVTAAFLAAAARACDDPATAERLEKGLDAQYLRRTKGFYWLDLRVRKKVAGCRAAFGRYRLSSDAAASRQSVSSPRRGAAGSAVRADRFEVIDRPHHTILIFR